MKENYFETLSEKIVHKATIEYGLAPYILNKGRYHKIRVTGYNTLPYFKIQDVETNEEIFGILYMIDREGSDFIFYIDFGSDFQASIIFYGEPSKKEEKKDYLEKQIDRVLDYDSGVKHDSDKLPYFTVLFKQFPNALREVVKCSAAGHEKYKETDLDWQNFSRVDRAETRYKDAMLRHMTEEGVVEDMLSYGEVTHEAAVVWNALADLEIKLRNK